MPTYGTTMGPKSTRSEWQVDLSAFRPLLLKTIADIFTPKATRMQQQQQEALTMWDKIQTLASKLPEEEKKNLYGQFFRGYGVYQPPWIRSIFGAGPEPVMPLPEGAKVTQEPRKFLGKELAPRTVYTLPQTKPLTFAKEPILPEQTEREIEEQGKKLGWTPEQIQDEKENVIYRSTSGGWPRSAQGIELRVLERAQKRYQQNLSQGLLPEQAMAALPFGERRALEDDIRKKKLEAEASEALTTQRKEAAVGVKERTKIAESEVERKRTKDRYQHEYQLAMIKLAQDKEKRLADNAKSATSGKSLDQVIKNTEQAYRAYRVAMIQQNKLELDKANKTKMEDVPYVPSYATILEFEDWLADEGRIFKQRIDELKGGEGQPPAAPGAPPQGDRNKKMRDFLFGAGNPPKQATPGGE